MTATGPSDRPGSGRSSAPPGGRLRPLLRRYPATATVTGVTAVVGAAQFVWPDLLGVLQRDPAQLHDGEWWRLITPLLVQSDGLGQYAYNLAGSAVVGVAVESRYGHARWLAYYLAGGLAGQVASYHWQPDTTGAGSSDAVAGLIGALTIVLLCDRAMPAWPAYLYSAHFVAYLTVLDVTGFQLATVAGGAALVMATIARRRLRPRTLTLATATAVIAGAVAMAALRDAHGVGLISGLVLAAITTSFWLPRLHHSSPEP